MRSVLHGLRTDRSGSLTDNMFYKKEYGISECLSFAGKFIILKPIKHEHPEKITAG